MNNEKQLKEKIEKIEEAMQLIEEAQTLVDEAVRGTGEEAGYNAYGKYGFNQLLGNGNPYDNSLNTIINNMTNNLLNN